MPTEPGRRCGSTAARVLAVPTRLTSRMRRPGAIDPESPAEITNASSSPSSAIRADQRFDLLIVRDVTGHGLDVPADLLGDGIHALEVEIRDDQVSPRSERMGDGGPHARACADHDIGHLGSPSCPRCPEVCSARACSATSSDVREATSGLKECQRMHTVASPPWVRPAVVPSRRRRRGRAPSPEGQRAVQPPSTTMCWPVM